MTKLCKHCKTNNVADAAFCASCGEKLFELEPSKNPPPLICTQCKNLSTNLWPGELCPNCGSSLEPQPNNVPPKKKSSNLIFSILAVILIFIVIVFYIGLTVQTGSESQPTAKQYFDMGVSNLVPNQYEKAIDDFTKAIELNPNFAEAYYNRGTVYATFRQYGEALNDWDKVLEIDPNHSDAINNREVLLGQHPELKP